MRNWGWGIVAVVLLSGAPMAAAAPLDYKPLGPAYESVVTMELMDGETADAVFHTFIKSDIHEQVSALHLWTEASLVELQDKAQAIVGEKPLTDECSDKVTITDVTMSVDDSHAKLCGTVVYDRQICSHVRIPEYKGTRVTYEDIEVARDTLSSESGEICAAVWPELHGSYRSFVLDYEVTLHELASTLADLSEPVDVAELFYDVHLADAFAAVTEAGFPVPEALDEYDGSVTAVRFVAGFEGMLMMEAEALVPVAEGEVADIVIKLLTATSKRKTGT